MIRTRLCDLFGIDFPIIQAPFGPWTSAKLVAAVSNAGALGSLGGSGRSAAELRKDVERIRELTDKPFAVNHITRSFDEEAFEATIEARPAVVSLALGEPGELVGRVHDAGSLFMQQVHTVEQARRAAEQGVDVIIAQGSEAGGFGGTVAALPLIPQVVDAVNPLPVVAAGGIADGRGLAAALVLGAEAVNVGTRFLACREADRVSDDWKRWILESESERSVKVEFWNEVFEVPAGSYATIPRALSRPFLEEWGSRRSEVEALMSEIGAALEARQLHELVPFAGQTAGLIRDVLTADEIVKGLVAGAQTALRQGAAGIVQGSLE
jgi:enoyl-[acyl-carrier protein] reductase II